MTDEMRKNFTLRISQANKSEMTVILYEMYLVYLDEAIHSKDDRQKMRGAIKNARGCISEFMQSLDFNYELSYYLLRLYVYVNKEMAGADVRGDVESLKICKKIMTELMEAYREVGKADTTGPVMENTQAVYAGLTYGKGELTESLAHQGNRGFLI